MYSKKAYPRDFFALDGYHLYDDANDRFALSVRTTRDKERQVDENMEGSLFEARPRHTDESGFNDQAQFRHGKFEIFEDGNIIPNNLDNVK